MTDTITSELVVAYSHCPRKAYLISKGEVGDPHPLVEIIERKAIANREPPRTSDRFPERPRVYECRSPIWQHRSILRRAHQAGRQ